MMDKPKELLTRFGKPPPGKQRNVFEKFDFVRCFSKRRFRNGKEI